MVASLRTFLGATRRRGNDAPAAGGALQDAWVFPDEGSPYMSKVGKRYISEKGRLVKTPLCPYSVNHLCSFYPS